MVDHIPSKGYLSKTLPLNVCSINDPSQEIFFTDMSSLYSYWPVSLSKFTTYWRCLRSQPECPLRIRFYREISPTFNFCPPVQKLRTWLVRNLYLKGAPLLHWTLSVGGRQSCWGFLHKTTLGSRRWVGRRRPYLRSWDFLLGPSWCHTWYPA